MDLTASRNLAATMFAPGASDLAAEFQITNSFVEALTVSIYVLGFVVGPLILAPLSEVYGRLGPYHYSSALFLACTIGCAFSTNTAMFLVFRFVCGCAASGPMSIGGAIVADITVQEERGKAMALFAMGPLLGPVCTPRDPWN
jgi:MFS family permease